MISFATCAMEKSRLPLSPFKDITNWPAASSTEAEAPAGVVTPSGKALRLKIAQELKRCIEGNAQEKTFPEYSFFSGNSYCFAGKPYQAVKKASYCRIASRI